MTRPASDGCAAFAAKRPRSSRSGRPVLIAAMMALATLGACESNPVQVAAGAVDWYPVPLMAADLSTLILTDKTIVDNVYSLITGKDCSTIYAMDGDYYCREILPDNRAVLVALYCYRSLAGVTCYDTPQPRRRNQQVAPPGQVISSRAERIGG
ncbi:hypothetical protein CKO38_14335 [Rhodospirillum rubrum]|uniref:hypothetical protein n=1 Tax=Rhodospirillum rubrum TaxID=1085 RepID=UPI001A9395AB|nr:hypothetical protein [Rhodospirillum rubrum]MBK1665699.1 hypothetical protein [Rhodospirillum rubrum]MBK1677825.1 hypothetical protein [Rhodospirillum rubrum]